MSAMTDTRPLVKAQPPPLERPNLLWIMADDLGVGELSIDGGRLRTPNLDKLAASGMRFTAAYAGYTVCAPSRATLFSGRNSGRLAGLPADGATVPRHHEREPA